MVENFGSLRQVIEFVIIEGSSIEDREHLTHRNLPGSRDLFIIVFLWNLVTGSRRHRNIAELLQFRVRIIVDFIDLLNQRELQFLPSDRLGYLLLVDII